MRFSVRSSVGLAVGAVALVAVPVLGFTGLAGAATGDSSGGTSGVAPSGTSRVHPQLTDEQKQCLADHGVTPPTKPADGATRTPPTADQIAAMKAAAEACGLPARPEGGPQGGPRGARPQLTDEQKQCLVDQGVTAPTKPADGATRTAPTADQIAAFKAAAEACGLPTPPAGGPHGPGAPAASTTRSSASTI